MVRLAPYIVLLLIVGFMIRKKTAHFMTVRCGLTIPEHTTRHCVKLLCGESGFHRFFRS
jgi:hypothetical protein